MLAWLTALANGRHDLAQRLGGIGFAFARVLALGFGQQLGVDPHRASDC
jgi:hypothetical protein